MITIPDDEAFELLAVMCEAWAALGLDGLAADGYEANRVLAARGALWVEIRTLEKRLHERR